MALKQAVNDADKPKVKALDALRLALAFTVATKVSPAALHRPAYQHALAQLVDWILAINHFDHYEQLCDSSGALPEQLSRMHGLYQPVKYLVLDGRVSLYHA